MNKFTVRLTHGEVLSADDCPSAFDIHFKLKFITDLLFDQLKAKHDNLQSKLHKSDFKYFEEKLFYLRRTGGTLLHSASQMHDDTKYNNT